MTEEEANEKLGSMSEEDIQNLEGDELLELNEALYGEEEEYEEEDEPEKPELKLKLRKGETEEEGIARIAMEPEVRAAILMCHANNPGFDGDSFDLNALIEELNRQTDLVKNKKSSRAEEMLTAQTHTLDMLFNRLTLTAEANIGGGFLDAANIYLKLAMKAQSQCRTTWEAISKIQNPPIANYVKQQNVAHNQQVNNQEGEIQETEKAPNHLLEKTDVQRLDTRAPGEAVGVNSNVETLETVNRAANGTG